MDLSFFIDYRERVAETALKLGAIKLNPKNPFEWASGYRMPIYNDNRLFLFRSLDRAMIGEAFENLIEDSLTEETLSDFEVVAGTSTAGIPWAYDLSERMCSFFVYVRDKPKSHGLKNQIEGKENLSDYRVILIEDLISTGESSARAVQAIRDAGGDCENCFSIFDYGFEKARDVFAGKEPYDKDGNRLKPSCYANSILDYDTLLGVARDLGYVSLDEANMLEEWRDNPFEWGEKRGFPRVEK